MARVGVCETDVEFYSGEMAADASDQRDEATIVRTNPPRLPVKLDRTGRTSTATTLRPTGLRRVDPE